MRITRHRRCESEDNDGDDDDGDDDDDDDDDDDIEERTFGVNSFFITPNCKLMLRNIIHLLA